MYWWCHLDIRSPHSPLARVRGTAGCGRLAVSFSLPSPLRRQATVLGGPVGLRALPSHEAVLVLEPGELGSVSRVFVPGRVAGGVDTALTTAAAHCQLTTAVRLARSPPPPPPTHWENTLDHTHTHTDTHTS